MPFIDDIAQEELRVGGTKINGTGLRAISTSLTRLTMLDLDSCSSITANGLKRLSLMKPLEDLNVKNAEISDKGLRSVDSLSLLKTLDLFLCYGISRVPSPPLSNPVVVASVAQCHFEGLDSEDEEDEY